MIWKSSPRGRAASQGGDHETEKEQAGAGSPANRCSADASGGGGRRHDEALRFYRKVLGADVELQIHGDAGERITILDVGRATLETSNPAQVDLIDRVEVGRRVSPHLRVAFEVLDAASMTRELVDAGAELIAAPTVTPWDSLNARVQAPGIQLPQGFRGWRARPAG